jgi:hypothetical protein
MAAAVQDVHHRRRQHAGAHSTKIAVERQLERRGRGARAGHRDSQNCVRTQLGLVLRTVDRNHRRIDQPLVRRVHPGQLRREDRFDVLNRVEHALAQVMSFVPIAELNRFVLAGRCAGWNCGAPHGSAGKGHVGFYSRISARIKNFAGSNRDNLSHVAPVRCCVCGADAVLVLDDAVLHAFVEFGAAIDRNGRSASSVDGCNQVNSRLLH